jgi:non-specific serine/threonine protein kinase
VTERLFGRDREVAALRRLILDDGARVVTVVGPPGVGKTRLATEVAGHLSDRFDHGTVFVDLASVAQAVLVPSAIARAVGVREVPDRPAMERLGPYLEPQHLLLVLDNFEHVSPAAEFVSALTEAAPRLSILVTSRSPLHLSMEHEFPVEPLATPAEVTLDAAQRSPAVALFVERARAVQPTFALTPHNAAFLSEICTRLEGLPLAVELAAVRIKTLPPAALAEHLSAPLAVLTRGSRDAPDRHRTLRDAMAWSDTLLDPRERQLLRRMAVFTGGWSLDAAHAVCAGLWDAREVVDGLEALIDHSLVQQTERSAHPRFRMLETIRQFAWDQLVESGEAEDARRRHARWALQLAEAAAPHLQGRDQGTWLAALDHDHENLQGALEWSLAGGDAQGGLRLAAALWWFWYVRGYFSDGLRWLERALAAASTQDEARLEALSGAAVLMAMQGDVARAQAWSEEGLAFARAIGNKDGAAYAVLTLGSLALRQRDFARARSLMEESAALFLESGNAWGRGCVLVNLQGLVRKAEPERASAMLEESVRILRDVGDKLCAASAINALAKEAQRAGDQARAAALFRESLIYSQELWSRVGVAQSLEGLAAATAHSAPLHAARLLGAAEVIRQKAGSAIPSAVQEARSQVRATIQHATGEEASAAAWSAGRRLTFEQAIAVALAGGTAARGGGPSVLTRREEEVAGLIAQGLTNREIASTLGITEKTAENHVLHIMNKLGVRSRAQIAVWAAPRHLHPATPS